MVGEDGDSAAAIRVAAATGSLRVCRGYKGQGARRLRRGVPSGS